MAEHKHLRIEVPNYDHTSGSDLQPISYIQLGGAPDHSHSACERGDDLLELVGLTESATSFYKDDYRYTQDQQHPNTKYHFRDGESDDDTVTPQTLTSQLLTRGGWRDHTDGNRICTTRGDKVEIIGGNFKQIILGRRTKTKDAGGLELPDGWRESYWESSGGHHKKSTTNTPGERVNIYWCEDTGTWRTVTETIKGDLYERYSGIIVEEYLGGPIITEIGGEDPKDDIEGASTTISQNQPTEELEEKWINPSKRKKERPFISETVYADSIHRRLDTTTSYNSDSTEFDYDEKIYTGFLKEKTKADEKLIENVTVDSDVEMTDIIGVPTNDERTTFDKITTFNKKVRTIYLEEREKFDDKTVTHNGGFTLSAGYQNSVEFCLGAKSCTHRAFQFNLTGASTAGIVISAAAEIKIGLFLEGFVGPTIEAVLAPKIEAKMVRTTYELEHHESFILREIFAVEKSWTGGHHGG